MKYHRLIVGCLLAGISLPADAVIFLETADPLHNTTTPGDNSGWQYEGEFNLATPSGNFEKFLGVPIAPYFFITAKHIGGSDGDVLTFHGDSYTTIHNYYLPSTDLRIWEVDHSKPFPTFAPLCSGLGNVDLQTTATIIGRGTQKGLPVTVPTPSGVLKGWSWGTADHIQRWGRNFVERMVNGGAEAGELLVCAFDVPGIPDECHLSVGDSGGGLFVLEDGLWRLAGVNFAVEGPFRHDSSEAPFSAAIFDKGGLEEEDPGWVIVEDTEANKPSALGCSRISASLPWILSVTGHDGSLALENYSAWQRLYFTPAEIGNPATTGPLADFDGDGIGNLLEFALNLDPSFNERVTLLPNTGLRGLPLIGVEADHLTLEFVRRTSGSGAGLTYTPQFSSDLIDWQNLGSETVVSINPRWERVKIVDPMTTNSANKRFVRVRCELAE